MKNPSSNSIFFAVVVIGLLNSSGLAQSGSMEAVRAKINDVLAPLPKLLIDDPSGVQAQRFLAENELTNRLILPYFYGVESPLHEPTPERQKRVRDVEDALSAHEPTLVALLRASASQTEVPDQLHRLIAFSPSTPAIKAALIEITQRSDASRSAALDAYNTLFKLKLDDDKLRQDVTTKIGFRDELHTRADQANELLVNATTQWGMAEMEPLFRDFLSVPYKLENYPKRGGRAKLQTHYELAVRGLAAFGKRAASFADLLKARLAEMDPAEDADLINACKETILIIEGKVNPKPRINLKGQLLGVSQVAWLEWRTTHGVDAAAMSQTTKDAALSVLSQTASKKTPEAKPTPTTPSNEPTSSAPWSIIAMLIVAAIGLLWLLVNKRK